MKTKLMIQKGNSNEQTAYRTLYSEERKQSL